jgi:pre-mRNA-splicing factor SYF1
LIQSFIRQEGIPVDTARRIYRRYLKFEPGHAEEYVEFLKTRGHWDEVADNLATIVNDDSFQSLAGKSKHNLWLELCDVITTHPADVSGLDVDAILRGGIRKFTDEVGRLWTSLADFYMRRGLFEKARDIYEEGLATVVTVRDFSLIFDAYTHFEESVLSAKMEAAEKMDVDAEHSNAEDEDGNQFIVKDVGDDIDLRLARLERLMSRRPELLSSVMLRQNPHNVHEWQKRIALFEGSPARQIFIFTEAVKTVEPAQALGKPHILWIEFARFYEVHGDFENARVVFEKAVHVPYSKVDDLATVWCEWGELELRKKNYSAALHLMRRATEEPPHPSGLRQHRSEFEASSPVQNRLYKSLKLWTFYCDLEESLGTLDSTRAVYERILELRIATPQIILNFALLLQENNFFEDSYSVYERGVKLFKFPHSREIWQAYLDDFVSRFGAEKLERARDLFEQCTSAVPPNEAKIFFLKYAQLEEEHGLARRAMDIYERACAKVPLNDVLDVYEIYVTRAMEFFGIGKVRSIYKSAIERELPHTETKALCTRFARLERKLGELDRARGLYIHGSQLANPQQDEDFWEEWNAFEVRHGNEDSFREMLRIKRSVTASFSQVHFNMTSVELPSEVDKLKCSVLGANNNKKRGGSVHLEDTMVSLEEAALKSGVAGFVKSHTEGGEVTSCDANHNPDEIELDDDVQDDNQVVDVEQESIPEKLFSGNVKEDADVNEGPGALHRFKKRRVGCD